MSAAAALQHEPTNVVSLDQYRRARHAQSERVSPGEVGELSPFMMVWMPVWFVPVMYPAMYVQDQR